MLKCGTRHSRQRHAHSSLRASGCALAAAFKGWAHDLHWLRRFTIRRNDRSARRGLQGCAFRVVEYLSRALGRYAITVNIVEPGFVATELSVCIAAPRTSAPCDKPCHSAGGRHSQIDWQPSHCCLMLHRHYPPKPRGDRRPMKNRNKDPGYEPRTAYRTTRPGCGPDASIGWFAMPWVWRSPSRLPRRCANRCRYKQRPRHRAPRRRRVSRPEQMCANSKSISPRRRQH